MVSLIIVLGFSSLPPPPPPSVPLVFDTGALFFPTNSQSQCLLSEPLGALFEA